MCSVNCNSYVSFFKVLYYLQAEDAERREKNLEEAKKITVEEDTSLPKPQQVHQNLSITLQCTVIISDTYVKVPFCPKNPGPEVIKLFSCSTQLSMKF